MRPYTQNPNGKVTEAERDRRVQEVIDLMGAGRKPHEIKEIIFNKYGIGYRQCERYVSRARQELLDVQGKTKQELRGEMIAFHERIIRDPKSTAKERQTSAREICELLGLYAPRTLEHIGEGGGPMQFAIRVSAAELPKPRTVELINDEN